MLDFPLKQSLTTKRDLVAFRLLAGAGQLRQFLIVGILFLHSVPV